MFLEKNAHYLVLVLQIHVVHGSLQLINYHFPDASKTKKDRFLFKNYYKRLIVCYVTAPVYQILCLIQHMALFTVICYEAQVINVIHYEAQNLTVIHYLGSPFTTLSPGLRLLVCNNRNQNQQIEMFKKGVNSTTKTRKWASATLVWSLNPGWISCWWSILSKRTTPLYPTYIHSKYLKSPENVFAMYCTCPLA